MTDPDPPPDPGREPVPIGELLPDVLGRLVEASATHHTHTHDEETER